MFCSLLLIWDQAIWCLFFVSAVTTHDISRAALPKPLVLLLAPLHNTSNLVEFLVELHESDSACMCTDSPGLHFPKWLWAKLIVANGFMISVGSQTFEKRSPGLLFMCQTILLNLYSALTTLLPVWTGPYLSIRTRSSLSTAHLVLGQNTRTRQPESWFLSICRAWARWLTVCKVKSNFKLQQDIKSHNIHITPQYGNTCYLSF